jgi:fumarylacetoacetate (FAA) hydrolase
LNETRKLNDPSHEEQWLQSGDVVELEVDELGILSNTITAEETDWSLPKR